MKKIITINVSPRKKGTSAMLLDTLKNNLENPGDHIHHIDLYSSQNDMRVIFDAVNAADTIVICGPCYVNTYPADTTRLLEELAGQPGILHDQNLYGIIQGGMPYAHTHSSGLNMLRIFAKKTSIKYQGGFVMGMGALLDGKPLGKLLNGKKVEKQFSIFCKNIHNGEQSPDSVYEAALLKIPAFVTRILAASMNRKIDKALAARGIRTFAPYAGSASVTGTAI